MLDIHRVVILGAGFAGVRVAHELNKAHLAHMSITVIDKSPSHLYTPNLYELAAAGNNQKKQQVLDRVTKLPLRRIFAGTKVASVQGEVVRIDAKHKKIVLNDKREVAYDTLVVALGSEANHFGIPGLTENAITLKSGKDAKHIRDNVTRMLGGKKQPFQIVIGGGGPAGVELAAALSDTIRKHPTGEGEITLVEAGPTVLRPFPKKVKQHTQKILQKKGVTLRLDTRITGANKKTISLNNNTVLPYNILVWTGGIQAPTLLQELPITLEKGRLLTGETLACVSTENAGAITNDIYALGDAACFHDGEKIAPWTAHAAMEQGKVVASNIIAKITGGKTKEYHIDQPPFVIPLGSRNGVAQVFGKTITGYPVIILKRLVELRYLLSIVGPWTAVRLQLGRLKNK